MIPFGPASEWAPAFFRRAPYVFPAPFSSSSSSSPSSWRKERKASERNPRRPKPRIAVSDGTKTLLKEKEEEVKGEEEEEVKEEEEEEVIEEEVGEVGGSVSTRSRDDGGFCISDRSADALLVVNHVEFNFASA